ncbi:MAG: thiolase family protein [Clostridiales bacterium]|jgi:acetyl-CoA C-acetyltransferase|nr:thiolase family protein [Clostridiales bacterium]
MYKNIGIYGMARTPVGSFGGSLKNLDAVDLGAIVISEAAKRSGFAPESIDEAIMGCVGQHGLNIFLGRLAGQKAGLPESVTGQTVNRMCASGLQAIVTGADMISSGHASIVVAGGAESMSSLPHTVAGVRWGLRMGGAKLDDDLANVLIEPFTGTHVGVTAENIAQNYNFSRLDLDSYALESQNRALAAIDQGKFKKEIVAVQIVDKKQTLLFNTDECPRKISLEKLSKLNPVFLPDGLVTAASASCISDGAAALVIADTDKADQKPLAKLVDYAVSGLDPAYMGLGPIYATKKLLKQTGLAISDIGLAELNEAFASQALACIKDLGLSMDIVNVNGGGLSLGHPLGATGAIISIKLVNEMRRRSVRYGLVSLCIGGGQGMSALFEVLP